MTSVADWMESTWLSQFVINRSWTWPTLESLHFLGLCVLMGAVLIMDLRLIGFRREIPLRAVHRLMPAAIAGFAVNLLTGVIFVFAEPRLYLENPAFQIKMSLIVLAGLNFLLYHYKVDPLLARLGPDSATPPLAKGVGAASLLFWFGVLAYGRLLPYFG